MLAGALWQSRRGAEHGLSRFALDERRTGKEPERSLHRRPDQDHERERCRGRAPLRLPSRARAQTRGQGEVPSVPTPVEAEVWMGPGRGGPALDRCESSPAHARAHEAGHNFCMSFSAVLCSAKLRDGSPCRSVATAGDLCTHHSQVADDLGRETVVNGDHAKKRNARERAPVLAQSQPLELTTRSTSSPSSVRPALALTAAEEVETIRRVLLEAATSTTRETWATCTCPECGKGFRQEISVPDHGARIKAIETLLREGLGRVGETNIIEPKMPTSVDEVKGLGWDELNLVFALTHATEIRAVVGRGAGALRTELESWQREERETLARVLAEVG